MGTVTIVKASAGSGKTYRLSYEYVSRVVATPELYKSILAVTFTNKATEEMKRRIIQEINDLANMRTASGTKPAFLDALCAELDMTPEIVAGRAKRVRTKILHDYSHFTILTIDKFFQRIIRAFIRELGVESDFTLELQPDSVLAAAAERLIEDTVYDPQLRNWIVRFVQEQIAEGKTWDIKREIMELGAEIFKDHYATAASPLAKEEIEAIISEAASKVRTIEGQMIAAAKEAVEIIESHNLAVSDFSYGKNGFANYFYKVAAGDITSGYGSRVRDALESEDKWYSKNSARRDDILESIAELYPLLMCITETYDKNIRFINTASLLRENYRTYAVLNDLAAYVREICTERNIMLISETNHIIGKLIEGNDAPFIFEKVGNSFSHYMIDEFQDTSLTQWNNFYPLLSNALSQSDQSPVLIVGDVKQSIYRWRGGDWEILGRHAAANFAGTREITLDKNYRSAGAVVRFNNALIARCAEIDNEYLNSQDENTPKDTLKEAYADSRQILAKTTLEDSGYVKIIKYSKNEPPQREKYIIESIESLQDRGYRAKDIAVIVRYNAEAVAVADILLGHKSANPGSKYCYDVVTSEALTISASPVVQFAVACLRLAANAADDISAALYRKHTGGAINQKLSLAEKEFFTSLRYISLEEAFERIAIEFSLGAEASSVAYVQAFHDRILNFANTKISDIPLFLKWWDEKGASESINLPAGQNAITIITIHKSKGLQFPAVIMPYASWGMNPKSGSLLWVAADAEPFAPLGRMPVRFKKAVAESHFSGEYYRELIFSHIDNINMLYVAVTRAEMELVMIMPEVKRNDFSRINELIAASLESIDMKLTENPTETIYEYGVPAEYVHSSKNSAVTAIPADSYPSFGYDGKLRIRRASDHGDANNEAVSPRSYGRLMHKVFESVKHASEVGHALEKLEKNGFISAAEMRNVQIMIDRAFADPIVTSWFADDWDEIRNESDIVVPADKAMLRRPDRTMIRGRSAVVVDYKFGQVENRSYNRQIKSYMDILGAMGYDDVSGYIWYVEIGRVERVAN